MYQMNELQPLFKKYSQNKSMYLSYNEIKQDFSVIKPTFNPILDMCIIKTLGTYITNLTNFQKWQSCPNLIDEIISINKYMYYDYNIIDQDIIDIINKAMIKYEQPSYTINKVYYFVSDTIKKSLNMNNSDDVTRYFEMKTKYNDSLNQLKIEYQDTWSDIEIKYDSIGESLFENFAELEDDVNFEMTIQMIELIGSEASKLVEQLIIKKTILIKENNTLLPQIKLDFDVEMDQIYEHVIASKKFDKMIHDVILEMYEVEKEIHRMSLTLEHCTQILNTVSKHYEVDTV
jgi:hypothetical protein